MMKHGGIAAALLVVLLACVVGGEARVGARCAALCFIPVYYNINLVITIRIDECHDDA